MTLERQIQPQNLDGIQKKEQGGSRVSESKGGLNRSISPEDIRSIEERDQLALNDVRKSLELPKMRSVEDLMQRAKEEGGMVLFHGGLPEDTDIEGIDLNRLGSQQNKRGRTYGGFYLTDESSKDWSVDYAKSRNGNLHGFLISPKARVLDRSNSVIDRLSSDERENLSHYFDLIKGKDIVGRVQYVLLNKDVVEEVGIEKHAKEVGSLEIGVEVLKDMVKERLASQGNVVVALSGKTGSGKTVFTQELVKLLKEDLNGAPFVLHTDSFLVGSPPELDMKKLQLVISEAINEKDGPRAVIVEGNTVIDSGILGRDPDVKSYIAAPADTRLAARMERDGSSGEMLKILSDPTPEWIERIRRFEAEPDLGGMDLVVHNNRNYPGQPRLFIKGESLVFVGSNQEQTSVTIRQDKIPFLEQLGIRRQE